MATMHRVGGFLLERPNLSALMAGAFGRLPQSLQSLVLGAGSMQYVPPRSLLRTQGDADMWLGVVSGALRLSTSLADGRALTLEIVGPGEFFGGIAPGQELRSVSGSTLLVLGAEAFRRLMQTEAGFGQFVAQRLSSRLAAAHHAAAQLAGASLESRVIGRLHDLAQTFGVPMGEEVRIDLPLVQQDVADMVGASRQRVNLVVGQLVRRGLLRVDRRTRRMVLCRMDALAAA
ncbi:MAG TPA: Crp/Fnr family transcriptional regulator [Burkholderiaceae bacterium]|nr:Crp/Fnr family transcriptional regulator [Burkholderiaceae bacterium]